MQYVVTAVAQVPIVVTLEWIIIIASEEVNIRAGK